MTRPVTVDPGQKRATATWVSGGRSLHSCSESSAVESGEGQMENVGLSLRDWTFRLTTLIEGLTLRLVIMPILGPGTGAIYDFSIGVLGVQFIWNNPRKGRHLLIEIGDPVSKALVQVSQTTRDARKRQKRLDLVYWDVMTFFEGWSGFRRKAYEDNRGLLLRLCRCIDRRRMDDPAVLELWSHRQLEPCWSVFSVLRGRERSKHADAMARTNPRRFTIGSDGFRKIDPPVPFRQIALHLGKVPPRITDSYGMHLFVLAVLLHLRADLEIYCETGLMRLARCQRAACRSWYATVPMAGKQKFCCESCRVMNFYERLMR